MRTLFSIVILGLASTLQSSALAGEGVEQRKISGADAILLSSSMVESGAQKVSYQPANVPSDHPPFAVGSEFVYRMEGIVCRSSRCEGFKVLPEKMKKISAVFEKMGVKETHPPVTKTGPRLKPFRYIEELICGAESTPGVTPNCFATAHFKEIRP
ncbi:MAG: hypothetical protein H7301_08630 [Cryobacterium sp.]|nr:hypothetical protein [Oligoflexia bacterium]